MSERSSPLDRLAILILIAACLTAAGCHGPHAMAITQESWGEVDGRPVSVFTLDNGNGLVARISDYGGIVTELHMPDAKGHAADVALGFETVQEYVDGSPYFGAMVGRVGNRIAGGRFELDGQTYQLAKNNGPNHLHGGVKGFDKVIWNAQPRQTSDGPALRLTHHSPDGEEGYPGDVDVVVDYLLTHDNELRVEMTATCSAPTPINVVHHTYWNLAGHDSGTILDHLLQLDAAHYTPTDATLIPTGEIASVRGTPFDFTAPKSIGRDIEELPPSGDDPGGYDLNFVLDDADGSLRRAARVIDPATGRIMEILTTQPGIQFYSGNFLDGLAGKGGANYAKHTGFCLETQIYPDSVNKRDHAGWPDPILRPGETYRHVMVHRFDW